MRLTGFLSLLSAAGLACVLSACSAEPNAVPTGPSPFTPAGGNAGRGGGHGAGEDQAALLTLGGDITSGSQQAVIDRDTKSRLKILAGADNIGVAFDDTFELLAAAGSPTHDALGNCVVNPSDAAMDDIDDVIGRLTDPEQPRDRVTIEIHKREIGGAGGHYLYHNWFNDDGGQYRTWLQESDLLRGLLVTVTNPSEDVYVFEGGSIVSWNMSTNVAIACPFTGSITVTLTR